MSAAMSGTHIFADNVSMLRPMRAPIGPAGFNEQQRTNLIVNSGTVAPTGGGATIIASPDSQPLPLFPGATVWRHTITGGPARGVIASPVVTPSTMYQCSFWAYVPTSVTTTQANPLYNNTGEGGTGIQIGATHLYNMSAKGTWQRLTMQYTTGAAETTVAALCIMRGLATGDVFYTTAFQCEAGNSPSSYIPTGATAATRAGFMTQPPDIGGAGRIFGLSGFGTGSGAWIDGQGRDADASQGLVMIEVGLNPSASGVVQVSFPAGAVAGQYVLMAEWATFSLTTNTNILQANWTATRPLVPGETLMAAYQWAVST